MKDRVCAVVVTFEPDLAFLRENLIACFAQVDRLVVVDNASNCVTRTRIGELAREIGCEVLQLTENLGVAAAQNRGVARARFNLCTLVIFFDQDSKPAHGMVDALKKATHDLTAEKFSVAAVGPQLLDRRTGAYTPFVRIGIFSVTKITADKGGKHLIPTDFLVSSGMLIAMSALDKIGLLEEGLFIDNVDLEWCFRARSMGFGLYGVSDAVLEHSVGDDITTMGNHVIHRHNPLRQYYIMRNRIILYQRSYSPKGWIVQDFFRLLFKFAAFSLFFAPRRQNFRMMIRGVRDGLRGKAGKYR